MSARVLVVDDVPANVKLLEARLSAEYFDVLTASNGAEALAICARAECDIILLDVMMPDIDGFEVCRQLKSNPATHFIPVVMVTALDSPAEKCLVDGERLDQRGERLHRAAHLAADAHILGHVRPDHDCGRAERQRLEHRHCRTHAIGARDVAGGRDHAAFAAADDHGLVGKLRIVAFLDGRIEGVAIDVREIERGKRAMTH